MANENGRESLVEDDDFIHVSTGASQEELTQDVEEATEAERTRDNAAEETRAAAEGRDPVLREAKQPAKPPAKKKSETVEAKGPKGETIPPTAETKPPAAETKPPKTETTDGDGKAKPDQSTPEGRRDALQAEINQLTREKHRTRAEKEAADAEIAAARAELAAVKKEIGEAKGGKGKEGEDPKAAITARRKPEPKEDDFEDFRDYVKAHGEWIRHETRLDTEEANLERAAVQTKTADEDAENKRKEEFVAYRTQLATNHRGRIEAYLKAVPEFDTIMKEAGDLPTNDYIDEHILHSEYGPQLMRYLAEHPAECEQIAKLGMGPTFVALGKIEGELEKTEKATATAKSGSEPKRPAVTRAKPPVNPVGSWHEVVGDDTDEAGVLDEDFSPAYVEKMNARDRQRQSRRL